jgi:hypothetical protein
MAQVEPPEERTKMKFTLAAVLVLSLCVSPALSQQQAASSAIPLTATLGQQPLPSAALFAAVTPTIRGVFGAPTVQPMRGLGIECSPVEQSIVGALCVSLSAIPLTATLGPQPLTTTVGQQPTAVTATVQPTRGLRVECTLVEQSIVGVFIGPTDLCDR